MGSKKPAAKQPSRFAALAARMATGLNTPAESAEAGPLVDLKDVPVGGLMSGLTEEASTREAVIASGKYREIEIALIDFDPYQPRKSVLEEEIRELADQIEAVGLLQPPIVRPHPKISGRYMVVFGERRIRAHQMLGIEKIGVRLENWSDAVTRAAQIVENNERGRKNVKAWEEALAMADLERLIGKQRDIVRVTGLSKAYVSKRLALTHLPMEVKELLVESIITDGEAAYELGTLFKESESAARDLIARARKAGRLERSWIRLAMRAIKSESTRAQNSRGAAGLSGVSERLNQWLHTAGGQDGIKGTVGVVGQKGKVRVELQFASAEIAEAFLEKLGQSS